MKAYCKSNIRGVAKFMLGALCASGLALPLSTVQALEGLEPRIIEGAGGVPINIVEVGPKDGPGILLIHGNGQSYLSWESQLISPLSNKYHIVAYDLRGHGNSGKPWDSESYAPACTWADDIRAIARETGLKDMVLVGWSRGGLIVMHYIQCYGTENVAGVVMVSSRGRLVDVGLPDNETPAQESQRDLESDSIDKNIRGARTFASLMVAIPQSDEWMEQATLMNLLAPPYARRAMRTRTVDRTGQPVPNYYHLAEKLDVPIKVILGGKDPIRNSADMAQAYRKAFPHADISLFPQSGHSPFVEEPEEFNAVLARFTDSVSGRVPE